MSYSAAQEIEIRLFKSHALMQIFTALTITNDYTKT